MGCGRILGLCALLAQLCQCDANQYHLVNSNGVYLLGKALLLGAEDKRLAENLGWKSTQVGFSGLEPLTHR